MNDLAPPPELTPAPAADPAEQRGPRTGAEVLLVTLLFLFLPSLVSSALNASGFFAWYYGPDLVAQAQDSASEAGRLAQTRLGLWVAVAAFPFQVALVPAVLWATGGTSPQQLGLTTRRFGRNLLLGVACWALLTPAVLGVQAAALSAYGNWRDAEGRPMVRTEEHPLKKLADKGLTPVEMGLWLFVALVTAAVLEELLFRGVLQPWAARSAVNAAVLLGLAFGLAALLRREQVQRAWPAGWPLVLEALAPPLFVLLLAPLLPLLRRRSAGAAGVFAASLLFAVAHTAAWPAPLALFVLALGLGTLAWRTESLVGPMVLHALFNGTSSLLYFLGR